MRRELVRVYLPADPRALGELLRTGRLPHTDVAYAVTVRLARAHPGADLEELEHAALTHAAAAAGAQRGSRRTRRVIACADVAARLVTEPASIGEGRVDPAGQGQPDVHAAAPGRLLSIAHVHLAAPVERHHIASFLVDERPGGTDDADLMWFDVTELPHVVDLATDLAAGRAPVE